MSNHLSMNLSSSEEEYSSDDDDIKEKIDATTTAKDGSSLNSVQQVNGTNKNKADNENFHEEDNNDDDDGDEFDDIDWEDGGDEDYDNMQMEEPSKSFDEQQSMIASTIYKGTNTKHSDDSKDKDQTKTKKKKKRSSTRKQFNKIPTNSIQIKELLRNIQRTHMLLLTSRSIFHSSFYMDDNVHDEDGNWIYSNEILNVAYSLIPSEFTNDRSSISVQRSEQKQQLNKRTNNHGIIILPNKMILNKFCTWFFHYVNHGETNRRNRIRQNIASGAPSNMMKGGRGRGGGRRRKRNSIDVDDSSNKDIGHTVAGTTARSRKRTKSTSKQQQQQEVSDDISIMNTEQDHSIATSMKQNLLEIFEYLSYINDDNPNIHNVSPMKLNPLQKTLVLLCMTRSMGWRVRFVNTIDPIEQDLTVEHPLFSLSMKDVFHSIMNNKTKADNTRNNKKKQKQKEEPMTAAIANFPSTSTNSNGEENVEYPWVEILTSLKGTPTRNGRSKQGGKEHQSRWIHVDPNFEIVDEPLMIELIRGQKDNIKKGVSSLKPKGAMIPVSYVVAIEHPLHYLQRNKPINSTIIPMKSLIYTRVVDVTPRYASKWSRTLRLRGASAKELEKSGGKCSNKWWTKTIKKANKFFAMNPSTNEAKGRKVSSSPIKVEKNKHGDDVLVLDGSSDDEKKIPIGHSDDDADSTEENEFKSSKANEAIPTSKTAFKNHPFYVIPSVLKNQEVLAPDAKKRICGMFKGELVYKRSDVSTALSAKKWLYESRKVRESELSKPVKKIKARKKPAKKGFQALTSYGGEASKTQAEILASSVANGDFDEKDDKMHIYGRWQTDAWSPPFVGPNDEIPVNEHKNVELALMNPGLVHLELHRISLVAKKLGIPYAPCLLGFEGHGGNRTPTIRGIVVHQHNADLLREAHTEYESQAVEDAYKKKQEEIYRRWKRLINGVLTTERLKREYGNS